MRAGPILLALALAGCDAGGSAVPRAVARPLRVMSMNLCADQLVLALLPPARIASVTSLSRDPGGSLMAAAAARVDVNHGLAEEVVRQRPDLVVAGSFSTPATRALLGRLGYPLLVVDDAQSLADIRRVTRQVAAAVGETARGEALIARMERQLAALARASGPRVRVAAWDGAGFGAGSGTLYDTMLHLAGAENVGVEPPATSYGRPDVEVLLRTAPTLLVAGERVTPGLGANVARHPLVRRYWTGRTLTVRQAAYVCGTPMAVDAAVRLRGELRAAAARVRTPLPFAP